MGAKRREDVDEVLPFVDEHRVLVPAPAAAVWRALTAWLARSGVGGSEFFARLLAAEPWRASGGPVREGATVPGFTVAEVLSNHRVRLVGRHRFSRYALTLTLVARADGTLLSARTHAAFPGLAGRAYRRLVIGSGAHRLIVGRLLRSIGREAA